jgi:predicted PurR-regulated permease PerM
VSSKDSKEAAKVAAKAAAEVAGPPTRVILRIIFVLLVVALILWVLVKLTGVLLLLVLAIFFAYLVYPLVEFLCRPIKLGKRVFEMPRVLAIALAYVLIIGALVSAIYLVTPRIGTQFPEFAEQARVYWRTLGAKAQNLNDYFLQQRMPGPLVDAINQSAHALVSRISETVSSLLTVLLAWLVLYSPWLILIPILSFFLLKDVDSLRRSALQMLPRGRWRWRGDEFFQDVNSTLAAYMRAQLTACLFVGILCAIGFTVLGLPGPLVMGFMAGLFEFVPLMGPLMIALGASVLALFHGGIFAAVLVLAFLGVLRVVQDYFVYPRLIGQGIHLHPLAVIIAIISGAEIAGVTGIFLAIPVVAILTVSYRHWLEHRGSEGLADLLERPGLDESLDRDGVDSLASRPRKDSTPEDMARARPDLMTGKLKMPLDE